MISFFSQVVTKATKTATTTIPEITTTTISNSTDTQVMRPAANQDRVCREPAARNECHVSTTLSSKVTTVGAAVVVVVEDISKLRLIISGTKVGTVLSNRGLTCRGRHLHHLS